MRETNYPQIQETTYYEKLENGLEVILIPKKGFQKTYALFSTKFGSIDHHFVPRGETEAVRMPDGIAHFLEHKLFEKEEGDVFQLFGKQGASANAFTSFTRTAYLFSTTAQLRNNLLTLIDFVQEPYFTDQTVNKEKGIIAQEIQMYDDSPDWRLFFGLLENLYPDQPVHVDIAGTVESIQQITPESLYKNYETFYHPGNMKLVLAGKLEPEEVMSWIRKNQSEKEFLPDEPIERIYPPIDLDQIVPYRSIYLPVNRPKALVGVRGTETSTSNSRTVKKRLTMELLLNLLFGETSSNYLELYDEGLIDDSFSYEYSYEEQFDFVAIGGDTRAPEKLSEKVKEILQQASSSKELNEEHFRLNKRKMIGQLLQALNSPEYIANQFFDFYYEDVTLFDLVPIVEQLTLSDAKEAAATYFLDEVTSVFHVLPEREVQI